MMATLRARLWRQLATWALRFGQERFARACYGRALEYAPDDIATLAQSAYLDAQSVDADTRSGAITAYERIVALRPAAAESWFNLGFLRQTQGEHMRAIEAFAAAVRHQPRLDRAWYGLALSRIALGDDAGAIDALQRTVALQPMSPDGYVALARTQHRLRRSDDCAATIRALGGFDPRAAAMLEDETGIHVGVGRWWQRE